MPNQKTLDLLNKANSAIFEAEQAIRKEEEAHVNRPMYRMRIGLADIIRRYCASQPVCGYDFVEMSGIDILAFSAYPESAYKLPDKGAS